MIAVGTRRHVPLLALVAAILLMGLWTGLERLGWVIPNTGAAGMHGPLMVCGVLGTLICAERAVALVALTQSPIRYAPPLLTGAGGVLLLFGLHTPARLLITLGSLGLVVMFAFMVRRYRAAFMMVMAAGAICWLIGNIFWLSGQPVYQVVHWWIAFLTLTIIGERLELAHITRISPQAQRLFLIASAVFLAGVALTVADLGAGIRLAGVGEVALALWLLRYDIARHTIRGSGLPRFIAACLLAGYVWLGIGGVIGLWQGALYAGVYYEALLHALLLGFVFSMIFGHAPIIIPALTNQTIRFSAVLYAPLVLLHGSLVLREASALLNWTVGRQWGGLLNVTALLLFFGLMARLVSFQRAAPDQFSPSQYP